MLRTQDPRPAGGHLLPDADRLPNPARVLIGGGEVVLCGQGVRMLRTQDPLCGADGACPVGDGRVVKAGVEQADAGSLQQGVAAARGPEGIAGLCRVGGQDGGAGTQDRGQGGLVVVGIGPQGQDGVRGCPHRGRLPAGGGLAGGPGGEGVDADAR